MAQPSGRSAERPVDPGNAAKLELIQGAEARRMVAAWTSVDRALRGNRRMRQWALISNVALFRARVIGQRLLDAGICRANGTVLDEAQRAVALDAIRRMKR